MRTPKLIPLDMSLADKHEHPSIKRGKTYLCLIGGAFYAGCFSRQWYGWNFDAIYSTGLQFDQPGTNRSRWEMIWEIRK